MFENRFIYEKPDGGFKWKPKRKPEAGVGRGAGRDAGPDGGVDARVDAGRDGDVSIVDAGDAKKAEAQAVCSLSCEARGKQADKVGWECIVDVDKASLERARADLKKALGILDTPEIKKTLEKMGLKINFNHTDKYLPLMIKESKLKNDEVSTSGARGYFQMMPMAVADVDKYFGDLLNTKLEKSEPVYKSALNNCIYGILFHTLAYQWYAEKEPFKALPEDDRKMIGSMIYNAGFTNVKNLWDALAEKPKSFADFEKKLAEALAKQLGASGNAKTVLDPKYNICYLEYPGITKYLDLLDKKDKKLEDDLKIEIVKKTTKGKKIIEKTEFKNTGVKAGKAGEALRYARVIAEIERQYFGGKVGKTDGGTVDAGDAGKDAGRDGGYTSVNAGDGGKNEGADRREAGQDIGAGLAKPGVKDAGIDGGVDGGERLQPEEVILAPGASLWKHLEELRKKIIEWKIEGFESNNQPEDYGDRDADRIRIFKIVQDFNSEFNDLEIKDLQSIPAGVKILLPGKTYVQEWVRRSKVKDDEEEERARKVKEEAERLGLKKPYYLDDKLETEGSKKLSLKDLPAADRLDLSKVTRNPNGSKDSSNRVQTSHIILHSTNVEPLNARGKKLPDSARIEGTLKKYRAHFVVDRDGTIYQVRDMNDNFDHAGRSGNVTASKAKWDGDGLINDKSIGIEVATFTNENWTEAQKKAVKKLVYALGDKYQIPKRNVLGHSQVVFGAAAKGQYRFCKWDPKNIDWKALGLPNNYELIDYDVVMGMQAPVGNLATWAGFGIDKNSPMFQGAIKSDDLPPEKVEELKKIIKKVQEAEREKAKAALEKNHKIFVHKPVKKGETIGGLAKKYGSTVEKIRLYNGLSSNVLKVGQSLGIPIPYVKNGD